MLSVCFIIHWKIENLNWNTTYNAEQHIKLLTNITYPPDAIFYQCSFLGVDYPCNKQFLATSVTNKGICYTFNGMAATDIYRDIV